MFDRFSPREVLVVAFQGWCHEVDARIVLGTSIAPFPWRTGEGCRSRDEALRYRVSGNMSLVFDCVRTASVTEFAKTGLAPLVMSFTLQSYIGSCGYS